ncbi:MAG: rhomboid family intramembrane serine protease [Proteobacteria bacterium]|nr:MAG: rhomboid family intramembrane serine protease [Pseudomonadota bacterium]TDJ69788.1 MAG: rhomboid family intramembrane serine protease [Pseudomonadota bacterium]
MLLFIVTDPPTSQTHDELRFRQALYFSVAFAVCLWAVKIVEAGFGLDFTHFGNYPGRIEGLRGIVLGPLIHGTWAHLVTNTVPIIVLGTALLYGYPKSARIVIPVIYMATGIGVWLFARDAYHIGASGLTFGMMFFVFSIGAIRWDRRAIALAMIVFFLYGGMIWGIFPGDPAISFESHFFGAIIGIGLAAALKNRDPAPPEKRYSWEDEDEDEDQDDGWR